MEEAEGVHRVALLMAEEVVGPYVDCGDYLKAEAEVHLLPSNPSAASFL